MSEDEDHIAPEDEQKLVAAEYVLGVLDMTDRRIAARQIERTPALARDVEDWEQRLGSLADSIAPEDPPAQTWDRIEAAIGGPRTKPAPVADPGLWQSLLFWRTFAIGSAALAAASVAGLTYLSLTPPPVAGRPMMATLGQTSGQPGFVAALGTDGKTLTIVPAALLAPVPVRGPLCCQTSPSLESRRPNGHEPQQPQRLGEVWAPEAGDPGAG